jgi:hypothetical protein
MIRAGYDAIRGVAGILRLVAFRQGWAERFDVSSGGVARSFAAALLAIPIVIFIIAAREHLIVASGAVPQPRPFMYYALIFSLNFLLFPGVAAIVTMVTDRKAAFGPWIVLHNWAALSLFLVQGLIWAIYLAGLLDAGGVTLILSSHYVLLRVFVHCRVAIAALGLPWPTAIGAAIIPMVAQMVATVLIADAFPPIDPSA